MNKYLFSLLISLWAYASLMQGQATLNFPVNTWQAIQGGQATVTHTQLDIGTTASMFDGDFNSVARTVNINPLVVTLVFDYTVNVTAMSTRQTEGNGWWTVEAANTVAELDNRSGTYQVLFGQSPLSQGVTANIPVTASKKAFRLTMHRITGDNYVHLMEWGITATASAQITGLCFRPNQLRMIRNSAYTMQLMGVDALGNQYLLPSGSSWSSSNTAVASVNNSGLLTSFGTTGTTNLTASWSGLSKTIPMKVVEDFTMPLAQQRVVKVALVIIDPPIPAAGGKRFSQVPWTEHYGAPLTWEQLSAGSPMQLAQKVRDSLTAVSGGVAKYEFVETHDDNELHNTFGQVNLSVDSAYHLFKEPGWDTWHLVAEQQGQSVFRYNELLDKYNLCEKSNNHQIDEVWVYAMPFIGMWESNMTGTGAFWINGPVITGNSCTDLLSIMGMNYERSYDLALHNFGHRTETTLYHLFNQNVRYTPTDPPYPPGTGESTLRLFFNFDDIAPGHAQVGNIHFPPNADQNYGYYSTNTVTTYEQNWKRYPFLFQQNHQINCSDWNCEHDGFMRWWLRRLPKYKCLDREGYLNNWWPYIIDFNEGKALEAQTASCDCQIFDDPVTTDYCASSSNFPWEDWIAKVKVGSIDNASGKSTYSHFTNLSTNLNTGATPIGLTTGFSYFTWDEYWRVWIDLNHDGDFDDAGEKVFEGIKSAPPAGSGTSTLNGNLNIPASAMTGPTRMRVSMKRGAYATPCETLAFGEVEDYMVNIVSGGGACAIAAEASDISCNGDYVSATILVTGVNTGTDWVAVVGTPGGPVYSFGEYGIPKVVSFYKGSLNYAAVNFYDPSQASISNCTANLIIECPPSGTNCQSYSYFPWEDWIANVELGNLSNASGKSAYSDFTSMTANLQSGSSPTVKLTTDYSYFTWDEYWRIWIDFNHDGDFADQGEMVLSQILPAPPAGTASKTLTSVVTIPASVQNGLTRMRISMKRGAYATPCETLPFGEVEDYNVNISGGGGACSINIATGNIACQDNGTATNPNDDTFTFEILVTGSGVSQNWQMTWPGGSTSGIFTVVKTVGPLPVSAFSGGLNFTIFDNANQTCSTTGSVTPPSPCSGQAVCGFSKEYQQPPGYNSAFYADQTGSGFKLVGSKPTYVGAGIEILELFTDQDGNFVNSVTKVGSAAQTSTPRYLQDGNFLFSDLFQGKITATKRNGLTFAMIWTDTVTVPNAGYLFSLIATDAATGEIYVLGLSSDTPQQPYTNVKLVVVKWNSQGQRQWVQVNALTGLQNTPTSIFTAKANAAGELAIGIGTSAEERWVGKLSSSGNLNWMTLLGGFFTTLKDVIPGTDGSVMAVFLQTGAGGPTYTSVGWNKYSASGTLLWGKSGESLSGNTSNPMFLPYANPIAAALPGGGFAVSFNSPPTGPSTPAAFYIAEISHDGNASWTKKYTATDLGALPQAVFIRRTTDGGNLLTGSLNSQLWLMKTDNTGAICGTPPPTDYCASKGDFPWHEWIARVKVGPLDNSSGKNQYSDFTGLSVNLQKNNSYPVTLTTGFSYFTWDEYWRVWIDFNHDGVFSTPDEVVQQQILAAPAAGTPSASVSGNINVPISTLTGPTRMRVSMKRGTFPTSCETLPFGEVEDYTVNIVNSLNDNPGDRAEAISFEAVLDKMTVRLYGAFYMKEPVAKAVFEKSQDGLNYHTLAALSDLNEAKAGHVVEALDEQLAEGPNHYRLLLYLDYGEVKISPVRIISWKTIPDFTVFPNPASNIAYLKLENLSGKQVHIRLLNAQGILMKNLILDELETPLLDIPLDNLPSGYYFLWVESPGRRTVGKAIVIENGF
jgi:hypothetical protein